MNELRVWLIHRLGGVEKPLPTTMPGNPWTGNSSSFSIPQTAAWYITNAAIDYTNVPTKRKRRWHG